LRNLPVIAQYWGGGAEIKEEEVDHCINPVGLQPLCQVKNYWLFSLNAYNRFLLL
jgi:hypothetical protein